MRLPLERFRTTAVVVALVASCAATEAFSQDTGRRGSPLEDAAITRAVEAVRTDPNVASEETIKTLSWKGASETKPTEPPSWVKWIVGLFTWIEQSAGLLMWGAIAVLAVMLVAYIVRTIRRHGLPTPDETFIAPTHVRDLDIRPETLPDDIGAAARSLWDNGEHRAALALLYRGLLSRLAHVHRVPIRDSSTEGDCLALAAVHLAADRHGYTTALVRAWQRFVYGGQDVETTVVHGLCDGFAPALDARLTRTAGGTA